LLPPDCDPDWDLGVVPAIQYRGRAMRQSEVANLSALSPYPCHRIPRTVAHFAAQHIFRLQGVDNYVRFNRVVVLGERLNSQNSKTSG
jgi:hypothetical protein